MEKKEFSIPEGANKITLEVDKGMAIITIGKTEPLEFESKITGELEQHPTFGDVSIFWNDDTCASAVIGKCIDWESLDDGVSYEANDGTWYKNAIRFRNGEQYNQILHHGKV